MAIAPVDRDPARHSSASEPRFKLSEELCRAGDATFWRAQDRRTGRPCVVRVFDGSREDCSRRLGELHRERTLAERLGLPGMLRTDVPLIEDGRIHQLVDPEPVRLLDAQDAGGRLALLTLLVSVARTLSEVHARGAFHGAFSEASCLRTAAGRVVVQGFVGDSPAAATVRDGVAEDHRAFLAFAQQILQPTGGPPPRLRRYFMRQLEPGAPRVAQNALATLADELRESLEDTFPWPAGAGASLASVAVATSVPTATAVAKSPARVPAAVAAPPAKLAVPAAVAAAVPAAEPAPAAVSAPAVHRPRAAMGQVQPGPTASVTVPGAPLPAGPVAVAASVANAIEASAPVRSSSRRRGSPVTSAPDVAPPDAGVPAPAVAAVPPPAAAAVPTPAAAAAPMPAVAVPAAAPVPAPDPGVEVPRARRSIRPWIGAILVLGAAFALWHFGGKGGGRPEPSSVPPRGSQVAPAAPAVSADAAGDARSMAAPNAPPTSAAPTMRDLPVATEAPRRTRERSVPAAPAPVAAARVAQRGAPEAEAAQATRSRVATLVAGGNRALNALEPGMAGEAFAAALALAPNDRAAIEGSQRARRLAGVAALMRDAREASARGDHARAVQGYSQALSNDPRNRGLAEALANARRNLARDGTGQLLAEGHAALGAGRLEAARAAFERALAADPGAPGARRGVEQAITAIALRDEATARRVAAVDTGS